MVFYSIQFVSAEMVRRGAAEFTIFMNPKNEICIVNFCFRDSNQTKHYEIWHSQFFLL